MNTEQEIEAINKFAADKIFDNKWIQCIILIVLAFIITKIVQFIIKRTLSKKFVNKRSETLIHVIGKLVSFFVYMLAIMQCFQVAFNVQPASLIAATGVVGVALGFGAQSIVKDVISGFFLLFENQIAVGDLVTIGGFTGTITELTLRSTIIKNYLGDVFIIPNGSITTVTNHSKCERTVMIDASVSYDDNIEKVMQVMNDIGEKAAEEIQTIVGKPQVLGVTELGESGITVRLSVNCITGEQFAVEREMLKRVKEAFDKEGICIPYRHLIVLAHETQ